MMQLHRSDVSTLLNRKFTEWSGNIVKEAGIVLSESSVLACSIQGTLAQSKWRELLTSIYGQVNDSTLLLENGIYFSTSDDLSQSIHQKLFKSSLSCEAKCVVNHHQVMVL